MTITPQTLSLPYSVTFDFQHEIDAAKVLHIADKMNDGEDFDPILVVGSIENGYTVLDGHHRARAAQISRHSVEAYVISPAQYQSLIDAEFGGQQPDEIMDLDKYIELPDGQIYSDVRDVD